MSHDGHVDSSPRRDDDDDDDDECVDAQRRRVDGTSTVTSRSGSPAVDSTTTDYCSPSAATGDVADRSNETSSCLGSQRDGDDTPARCTDKPARQNDVVNVADQPLVDQSQSQSADEKNMLCDREPQTSLMTTDDITPPSGTQNNLARLEIMTCIAGGNVDQRQNTVLGLQIDSTLRVRRGQTSTLAARLSIPPASGRCDGRRARAGQRRTRTGALMATCGGGGIGVFDSSVLSTYKRAASHTVDSNCVTEFQRECSDTARDFESPPVFPSGPYIDTTRCLYSDLTTDSMFPSDSYTHNSVSSAFQHQQPPPPCQSYDSHFQSAVVRRPSSLPTSHCSVRSDSDSFTSFPHATVHSETSFPICEAGWQTWKDWIWSDCSSVDYDDNYLLVSGDRVNWRSSVDTRGWTNGGHDLVQTPLPVHQALDASRPSYWSNDSCSTYQSTPSYVMQYYDSGSSASSRLVASDNCSAVMPSTASSRFYDTACRYVPQSTSLSTLGAADLPELTPCQSVYQSSCKYSGVADGHCRLYTADDGACLNAPAFVNTA